MKTFSIKRSYIETWQPYLALCAFLEGDLSLLGSPISVVHCEDVKNAVDPSFVMQSVKVNPSLGLQHRRNHISSVDFFDLYALSFTD